MGAGFGVMLIGSMVVISRWFPPDRFSTLTAMVLSIGLLGNLVATTPLAWASEATGWRTVFGVAVALHRARRHRGLAGGARRAARPSRSSRARPSRRARCCRACWKCCAIRACWPILALNFCNYACTFTVQGLWGGPYPARGARA